LTGLLDRVELEAAKCPPEGSEAGLKIITLKEIIFWVNTFVTGVILDNDLNVIDIATDLVTPVAILAGAQDEMVAVSDVDHLVD